MGLLGTKHTPPIVPPDIEPPLNYPFVVTRNDVLNILNQFVSSTSYRFDKFLIEITKACSF